MGDDASRRLRALSEAALEGGMYAYDIWRHSLAPPHIDEQIERIIRRGLSRAYPDEPILGEELGSSETGRSPIWVIDPIDGTDSFECGGSYWAVSVAAVLGGEYELGVVFAPQRGLLYQCGPGVGALLNGRPLRPESGSKLILFGWAGRSEPNTRERAAQVAARHGYEVAYDVPAAIGLVWLAAGRCAGYGDDQVASWDVAGGLALLRHSTNRPVVHAEPVLGAQREWVLASDRSTQRLVRELHHILGGKT